MPGKISYIQNVKVPPLSASSLKISNILALHAILANAYAQLLKLIDEEPIRRRRLGKPFVKYLAKAHVRRQYEGLYRAYMAEIVSQNGVQPQADVENLRKIAADLKGYYETLPSLKRYLVSVFTIFSVAAGIAGFLGLGTVLTNYFSSSNILELIILAFTPLMFSAIIGLVALVIFDEKRNIFSNPARAAAYWKGKSAAPAQSITGQSSVSIYEMENNIYTALGSISSKPKELPLDLITSVWAGGLATVFFVLFMAQPTITNFIESGGTDMRGMGGIFLFPAVYIIGFVVKPLRKYRKRLAARLL